MRINYWRAAALILGATVFGLGYAVFTFLTGTQAGTPESDVRVQRFLPLTDWPEVRIPHSENRESLSLAHDYAFQRDWHERHARYWRSALAPFRGQPDIHYLEVGLFEGASFFWVLENVLTAETAHATGIDPFIRNYSKITDYGDTFYKNLELSGLREKTTIIEGFSQIELRKLPLESYDIIYIDGSHKARDVLEDAILSWRLLKPGGLLIFDDYELWWERPPGERPRLAIDTFYSFFSGEFSVVHFGYQVMLRRRGS